MRDMPWAESASGSPELRALTIGFDAMPSGVRRSVVLANLHVSRAGSVQAAVEMTASLRPELVLCHVDSLGPDIAEALERLCSAKVTETLPILLVADGPTMAPDSIGLAGISEILGAKDSEQTCRVLIRAALRRKRPISLQDKQYFGRLEFDPVSFTLKAGQRTAALRKIDFCLIGGMLDDPNRRWSRELLNRLIFEPVRRKEDRTIDVFVSRVRRFLKAGLGFDPIHSVRGIGYALASSGSTAAAKTP